MNYKWFVGIGEVVFRHPDKGLPSCIALGFRPTLLQAGILRYFLLSSLHPVTFIYSHSLRFGPSRSPSKGPVL